LACFPDHLAGAFGIIAGQIDGTEPAGIGDCGRQRRYGRASNRSLSNGQVNPQQIAKGCFHICSSFFG
jgi:hypothetical protein